MELGFSSFRVDQEDHENSLDDSRDSLTSSAFNDTKSTSTSSPKRSRRATQKRVVSVPLKEVEGSRLKGETNAPPPDSWAWRKYGQKPIKGSPYPRGYYRCSSSKGCPARKQVERSRADPTMVMVTYSCDHSHPWPASRTNTHHHNPSNTTSSPPTTTDDQEEDPPLVTKQSEPEPEPKPDDKFTSLEVDTGGPFMTTTDQFGWFADDVVSTSSAMLECPLMVGDIAGDTDMAMIFSIREEDESLFADLEELPECTTVFKRKEMERVEEHHRRPHNLAPWCGTRG